MRLVRQSQPDALDSAQPEYYMVHLKPGPIEVHPVQYAALTRYRLRLIPQHRQYRPCAMRSIDLHLLPCVMLPLAYLVLESKASLTPSLCAAMLAAHQDLSHAVPKSCAHMSGSLGVPAVWLTAISTRPAIRQQICAGLMG